MKVSFYELDWRKIIDFRKVPSLHLFVLLLKAKFDFQPMLHIHLHLNICLIGRTNGRSLGTSKKNSLSEIWDHGIEEYFHFKDETQSDFFEGPGDTAQSTVSISIIEVKQLIFHGLKDVACS